VPAGTVPPASATRAGPYVSQIDYAFAALVHDLELAGSTDSG
jgi:hypothetical protein